MHVTQEGPDSLSRYCRVQAIDFGEALRSDSLIWRPFMSPLSDRPTIVGGVDTHKDLHVAAVVDKHDRVLGSASFPRVNQYTKPGAFSGSAH